MARFHSFVASVIVTVALAAAGGNAVSGLGFVVTGRVYCDACRAGFETEASHNLAGAKVAMECRHYLKQDLQLKAKATTDAWGWYKIEIDEDHQEEICEVILEKSPNPECAEIEEFRDRSRVPLTRNNGIKQRGVRFANPIAFFRKEPLEGCGAILKKYSLVKDFSDNP